MILMSLSGLTFNPPQWLTSPTLEWEQLSWRRGETWNLEKFIKAKVQFDKQFLTVDTTKKNFPPAPSNNGGSAAVFTVA